jgi:hypothetical protein
MCFVDGDPQSGVSIMDHTTLSTVQVVLASSNLYIHDVCDFVFVGPTSPQLVLDVSVHCLRFQVGTTLCALRNSDHWLGESMLTPKAIGPGTPKGLMKINFLSEAGLDVVTSLLGETVQVLPVAAPPVPPVPVAAPPVPVDVDDLVLAAGLRLSTAAAYEELMVFHHSFTTHPSLFHHFPLPPARPSLLLFTTTLSLPLLSLPLVHYLPSPPLVTDSLHCLPQSLHCTISHDITIFNLRRLCAESLQPAIQEAVPTLWMLTTDSSTHLYRNVWSVPTFHPFSPDHKSQSQETIRRPGGHTTPGMSTIDSFTVNCVN